MIGRRERERIEWDGLWSNRGEKRWRGGCGELRLEERVRRSDGDEEEGGN